MVLKEILDGYLEEHKIIKADYDAYLTLFSNLNLLDVTGNKEQLVIIVNIIVDWAAMAFLTDSIEKNLKNKLDKNNDDYFDDEDGIEEFDISKCDA